MEIIPLMFGTASCGAAVYAAVTKQMGLFAFTLGSGLLCIGSAALPWLLHTNA